MKTDLIIKDNINILYFNLVCHQFKSMSVNLREETKLLFRGFEWRWRLLDIFLCLLLSIEYLLDYLARFFDLLL